MNHEVLIVNVRDAIVDWDDVDFFDTVPKILAGIESGRLNKDDYEIRYRIMSGIYDPKLGDYKMRTLI